MANYLVTGGAGFIGSNIVEELLKRGESVRVLDDFSTGRRQNIAAFRERIELVEGSLTKMDDCLQACAEMDYILHQAAIPSVPRSVDDPRGSHEANITGTMNLLLAMKECGCKRLVCAASSSAYGEQEVSPKVETLLPDPLSPYAVQKATSERYCRSFALCYDLETVCLRYFNVFGPRQDPTSQYSAVIPAFITAVLEDRQPTIFGDGAQSRDFTYIANVIEGNLLAATKEGIPTKGEVFNLACGDEISLLELLAAVNELLGKEIEPIHAPPRRGDVKHSRADITKARKILGFEPLVDFKTGLIRTIEWYRNNQQG